jgi:DNA-binding phage protein
MTKLVEVDDYAKEANDRVQADARRLLFDVIDFTGLPKTEVARRVGRTRNQVNMILASEKSLNLRTLAHFLHAAGYRLELSAVPINGKGPTFR